MDALFAVLIVLALIGLAGIGLAVLFYLVLFTMAALTVPTLKTAEWAEASLKRLQAFRAAFLKGSKGQA